MNRKMIGEAIYISDDNANIKGKTLKCHDNANIKGKTLKCHDNANLKGKTLKCHDNANLRTMFVRSGNFQGHVCAGRFTRPCIVHTEF
jgi:hypothetical protein